MDSEAKVIDLNALSSFKSLQDSYNEEKFMPRTEFLDENGLIKSELLSISIENNIASYQDIYELFYSGEPDEDTASGE